MPVPVRRRHVLVVGMDGVRADTVHQANTPSLDALAGAGFAATVRVDDRNPTISGPVWSTVATGVYAEQHGVQDNDLSANRYDTYPDFLSRIRSHHPWASTFVAGAWGPVATSALGGPIFAGGGYRPALHNAADEGTLGEIATMDEAVTARTARELLLGEHAATFCYLLLPDMVGHHEGVTKDYRRAVETCDGQLAVLLAAIQARPERIHEEWTVIVATDHGHRDAGHHGGDSPAERNAWIVASGPGITAASGQRVDHADIPIHILNRFEVPLADGEHLQGREFATSEAHYLRPHTGSPLPGAARAR